jgi:hypothetical protein
MYFRNLLELKNYVDESSFTPSEQLMIMVGDKSENQVNDLVKYLNEKKVNFFGGIFAGLIVGSSNKREGFIAKKVNPIFSTLVFPFMMRVTADSDTFCGTTAIVFVDGLSGRMKDLTDTVYEKIGMNVTYVGGGAGFYDMKQRPCIFNNTGIYKDALYICILRNKTELKVEHGWNRLQGPFYVKRSYDNVLAELDLYKAFEVYKHVIEEEENLTLCKEDFFTYAREHPFGIQQKDGTLIVRDPISFNDEEEIICVANIPEGSDVYVLKGDVDTLLDSSLHIAKVFKESAPLRYFPMLFDCISRAMFLDDRFEEELANIQQCLQYEVLGALSIGEIACTCNGELVIHNKSTVLALMER